MAPFAQLCVYTVLLGGYEPLNEQPARADSAARFICYTDDPGLRSDSWEIRLVAPLLPGDAVRSQRWLKLSPESLPEVAAHPWSLYIDNSVILRAPPEALLAEVPGDAALALAPHSFRATLADEYQEVLAISYDTAERVMEQFLHIAAEAPALLAERPWWCGLMLRRHAAPRLAAAMAAWRLLVLRFSRRDQLSANLAFHRAGLVPVALPFDNMGSAFHSWPHTEGRNRNPPASAGLRAAAPPLAPAFEPRWAALLQAAEGQSEAGLLRRQAAERQAELELLRQQAAERQAELELLRQQVAEGQAEAGLLRHRDAEHQAEAELLRHRLAWAEQRLVGLYASRSWRLTAPLRRLSTLARRGAAHPAVVAAGEAD